jgi:hypothetical protein
MGVKHRLLPVTILTVLPIYSIPSSYLKDVWQNSNRKNTAADEILGYRKLCS